MQLTLAVGLRRRRTLPVGDPVGGPAGGPRLGRGARLARRAGPRLLGGGRAVVLPLVVLGLAGVRGLRGVLVLGLRTGGALVSSATPLGPVASAAPLGAPF